MNKKTFLFALAFSSIALTVFILWQVKEVVIYFFMSLVLGAALRPLANFQKSKTPWQKIGITLGVLLVIAGLGFLLYLQFGRLLREINLLIDTVSNLKRWFLPPWLEKIQFTRSLIELLPPPGHIFDVVTTDGGKILMPAIPTIAGNMIAVVRGLVIILFLGLNWTGSQDHFERLWLSLLPVEKRQKARLIWREIDASLGDYVRFLLVKFFVTWIVVSLGTFYLRSPYPILLGILVASANLVPIVGIFLSLLLTLAIGLLSSILFYPWILLYVFVVLMLLRVLVWPRFYSKKWAAPFIQLLLLLVFSETLGLGWLILAPPLAVMIQILWSGLSASLRSGKPLMGIESLRTHQNRLSLAMASVDEVPPALMSNLNRLDELIDQADDFLSEE
ncbi:MAG: AI-2E family transporter [Anaerolineaceae bacterium]|nr:AI-2E family transporter [Anaerolineaceae bacterium]